MNLIVIILIEKPVCSVQHRSKVLALDCFDLDPLGTEQTILVTALELVLDEAVRLLE